MMLQAPPVNPTDFIPIMGMVTGMVTMVLIAVTVIKVAQSQIGQAIARRLHGKGGLADEELRNAVLDLREQVADLEHRLAESEERIDFTERLLAQKTGVDQLPGKAPHAAS